MPWKDGYTTSDEKTRNDEEIQWPRGHQCAFSVVVDYRVKLDDDGTGGTDADYRIQRHPKNIELRTVNWQAEFGVKIAARRLFDLFEKYEIRATFAVPSVMADLYPDDVSQIIRRGHEVAAHGYRHEDIGSLKLEEEKALLQQTTEELEAVCGKRPAGWYSLPRQDEHYAGGQLSPHTLDLLIDAGYEYLGNGMADDIPYYWVTDFHTERNILTLPYYCHFDDQFFLMFPPIGTGMNLENPRPLSQNWKEEFDAQYLRGRYFTMFIHPYLIGWGNRLELLENMIRYIRDFSGVWNPTAIECARYWKTQYPSSTFLKLEACIWKD